MLGNISFSMRLDSIYDIVDKLQLSIPYFLTLSD